MKTSAIFLGALLLCACDDNKDKTAEASAPSASIAADTPAPSSSIVLPAVIQKKVWKCGTTPGVVDFAGDDALEKEVRLKLNKPSGPITPGELANVKSINLTKYGPVNELNPCVMPKFTQLHDLFIGRGDLDDLSPIADLTTMISLRCTDNKVKSVDALKKLVHMDRLDLSHTLVNDLSGLAAMTELTELEIDGTEVTDLKPLEKLTKLQKVTMANTAVKDVSPLRGAKDLRLLDVSGTPVTDYSMLQPALGRGLKVKMN
ncbi:MAG TPA: leucine-rich repeat domain-containing protein [Polyangiaceae bacterium]